MLHVLGDCSIGTRLSSSSLPPLPPSLSIYTTPIFESNEVITHKDEWGPIPSIFLI
jgi:hypothetical protein